METHPGVTYCIHHEISLQLRGGSSTHRTPWSNKKQMSKIPKRIKYWTWRDQTKAPEFMNFFASIPIWVFSLTCFLSMSPVDMWWKLKSLIIFFEIVPFPDRMSLTIGHQISLNIKSPPPGGPIIKQTNEGEARIWKLNDFFNRAVLLLVLLLNCQLSVSGVWGLRHFVSTMPSGLNYLHVLVFVFRILS